MLTLRQLFFARNRGALVFALLFWGLAGVVPVVAEPQVQSAAMVGLSRSVGVREMAREAAAVGAGAGAGAEAPDDAGGAGGIVADADAGAGAGAVAAAVAEIFGADAQVGAGAGAGADAGARVDAGAGADAGARAGADTEAAGSGPEKAEAPAAPVPSLSPRVVLAYWARWGDDPTPSLSLNTGLDVLDVFSPYWFSVRGNGSLVARESGHAGTLAGLAGKSTLLLVNNSGQRMLTDPDSRERAVDNIVRIVREYGVAGVTIDFELLPPERRDDLTRFVDAVAGRLRPEGYLVAVAVGPKLSADSPENDGAAVYDYEALGRIADLVLLMTYDQHGSFSKPGPVAGLPWVEGVVSYAASAIPPEKLLLGIAGYGYEWGPRGTRVVPAREAGALAEARGVGVEWDDRAGEEFFRFTDDAGAEREVWFESERAISLKLDIATRYDLRGVALWSLGQESPGLWPVLRGWRK